MCLTAWVCSVTVPDCMGPGDKITVRAPSGELFEGLVPADTYPGDTFYMRVPAAAVHAPSVEQEAAAAQAVADRAAAAQAAVDAVGEAEAANAAAVEAYEQQNVALLQKYEQDAAARKAAEPELELQAVLQNLPAGL